MRVGVIQSSFIPWRGYFDFIASVDVFVFLEDVQYSKGSWRNRNRIKTSRGTEWVTVPVLHRKLSQLIQETRIDYGCAWVKKMQGAWSANYLSSPFFADASDILSEVSVRRETISELNIGLIRRICDYLGISTPMLISSDLKLTGVKTDRLIDLVKKLGANIYLSGPSADDYLDKDAFRRNGVQLEYKSYDYLPYPQLWEGFAGEVTILDLIANCGPGARKMIVSNTANKVVVRK